MFKVLQAISYDTTHGVYAELYATTKEEVTDSAEITGLPAGYSLTSGSYGYTHAGELFIYDETEGFAFVGDDSEAKSSASLNVSKPLLGGLKTSVEEPTAEPTEEPVEEIDEVEE